MRQMQGARKCGNRSILVYVRIAGLSATQQMPYFYTPVKVYLESAP